MVGGGRGGCAGLGGCRRFEEEVGRKEWWLLLLLVLRELVVRLLMCYCCLRGRFESAGGLGLCRLVIEFGRLWRFGMAFSLDCMSRCRLVMLSDECGGWRDDSHSTMGGVMLCSWFRGD